MPRVLFVGRLTRSKNVHVILDALAALRAEGLSLPCEIVGDGPERGTLEAQIRALGLGEQVFFAGGVTYEQMPDHYEAADILVLASETEGWPKAIAEAMAFGLVAIGSDRGIVPWMLAEGRGLTVPPQDVKALVSAFRELTESPNEALQMGQRAATWGQQHSLDYLQVALRELLDGQWR